MNFRTSSRRAFTRTELVITVVVLGSLIAMLIPAVQYARGTARETQTQDNMRQLGLAVQTYHDSNRVFPAGGQ